jgi:two-component system OmpR family sensor kinase
MLTTLYSRLAAVLLLLCAGTGLLSLVAFSKLMDLHSQEVAQRLNLHLANRLVAGHLALGSTPGDQAEQRQMLDAVMEIQPGIDIYRLDGDGNVVGLAGDAEELKLDKVDLRPVRQLLRGGQPLPIRGDDPRDPDHRKVFSVAPIDERHPDRGYLYVILGGHQYQSAADTAKHSYVFKLSLWFVGGSVLFAALGGLVFFNALTRRLRCLAFAMDSFKSGRATERVQYGTPRDKGGDEIDRLGRAFNEMADRIVEQMRALEDNDRLRREMLANVSHDLRTPLASLQGYLETLMLKEGSLGEQERHTYLEVALKHTERLGNLIAELLDLAKLDSGERRLNWERFSLGELVQDVVQKFELAARARGVRLEATFEQTLPFVTGDIGLVERVFENLIQNALRHTPPGGSVRVAMLPSEDHVTVRVSDTGEGIPSEKIAHVFDRFYQAEKPQQEGSGAAGLGLAIAKRIVELHGMAISVESQLGAGATFAFSLPVEPPERRSLSPSSMQSESVPEF